MLVPNPGNFEIHKLATLFAGFLMCAEGEVLLAIAQGAAGIDCAGELVVEARWRCS